MRWTMLIGVCGAIGVSVPAAVSAQGIPRAEITMDDSYILGVRASVDQEEIETAHWAAAHSASKEVRAFAQSLLRGHSNAQNEAKNLAVRLKVDLRILRDTGDAISQRQAATQSALRALKGRNFDRAFLTAIRDEHSSEIERVQGWYASAASSDSVKAYLHDIMPTLVQHQQTAARLLGTADKTVATIR